TYMTNPLKHFVHGELYCITSRTEEGLPFFALEFWGPLYHSILARALEQYPVELVAHLLMPNHLHLMIIPINPEDVPNFIGYIKQELAHAVNQCDGRMKRTIWDEGYDSPVILDYDKAIETLVYIFTNSQNALLSKSIDSYR